MESLLSSLRKFLQQKDLDSSVSIHAVERFLGDEALKIIGNLSPKRLLVKNYDCRYILLDFRAYHLRKLLMKSLFSKQAQVNGGMMNFGIPAYRMPRNILQAEIKRIENFRVKIVLNYKVQDILKEKRKWRFRCGFVAIGAHLAKK